MKYKSVILSGPPKAGKSTLAESLSKEFNWPIYSIGRLWKDEWRRRYPNGEISFAEFWGNTTPEENRRMDERAKVVFEKGNVIGEVRYPIYLDPNEHLLVFMAAELKFRIERVRKEEQFRSMPLDELERYLLRREDDEVRIGKALYGKDYDFRDPSRYEITLNSGTLTLEQQVSIIKEAMRAN